MQELFSYSLMTSGLGILIVFLILVLLSVLMILIRKFSDIDTGKKPAATASTVAPETTAQPEHIPLPVLVAVAASESIPDSNSAKWLPAAVSAYIAALEDDSVRPRAINWATGGTAKYDPWVSNNKVTKTAPGA